MRMTCVAAELGNPRWRMDWVVCSLAASGFYLYTVWLARMFETSPLQPRALLGNISVLVLCYTLGALVGNLLMRRKWFSFIWVPVTGSALFPLVGIVSALPIYIDYYNRFTPDPSLLTYLIRSFAPTLLGGTLSFTVVTLAAALVARVLRSILESLPISR
jgi:hypothetical protein